MLCQLLPSGHTKTSDNLQGGEEVMGSKCEAEHIQALAKSMDFDHELPRLLENTRLTEYSTSHLSYA